jgi:ribosome maturation factor RimP
MVELARQVESLIREFVEGQGFELVHVEYLRTGASSLLRVYVDKPGGVTVDDCAWVSRQIGVILDVEDLISDEYLLEVSSPGVERPLFREEDFERCTGEKIRLKTVRQIENRRNFKGRLLELVDGVLKLDCQGQVFAIPLKDVKKANLVYQFD